MNATIFLGEHLKIMMGELSRIIAGIHRLPLSLSVMLDLTPKHQLLVWFTILRGSWDRKCMAHCRISLKMNYLIL